MTSSGKTLVGKHHHLEEVVIGGGVILKWFLKK
jgi:hypothetical protein